jgi:Uncharacterized protein conserved in bacteria
MTGTIFSLNCSTKKGTRKVPKAQVRLIEDRGVEGDAHAGPGIRQVSLLAIESIAKQKPCAHTDTDEMTLAAGDFAENITTAGIDLAALKIGKKIKINNEIVLEVTKIGKDCHQTCAIYEKIGDCIMPREGIFTKVIKGGIAKIGDRLEVTDD